MNNVERQLLDALLAGEVAFLSDLRDQLSVATLVSRELSGCGFFLHFSVPDSAPRVGAGRSIIGDVYFEMEAVA